MTNVPLPQPPEITAESLSKPIFVILGGPNGVGKTTGALSILPLELGIVRFLNADLIARGLSPLDPTLPAAILGKRLGRNNACLEKPCPFSPGV